MKRILLLMFTVLVFQTGWSQLGIDLGFGPQLAKMDGDDSRTMFLIYSPSLRALWGPVCFKAGLRKSIPRKVDANNYHARYQKTGNFEETGFVIGMSFTFNRPTSRTRPYFVLDYCKITSTFVTEELETNQVRFGAGFQFDIRNGFMFFNEVTYNSNSMSSAYEDSFSIEVGIRYFLIR